MNEHGSFDGMQFSRREMLLTLAAAATVATGVGLLLPIDHAALAESEDAPNVVLQWNSAALQAIRDTRPGPPMTARALAIVHTCMYDAWAVYHPNAVGTRPGRGLRVRASRSSPVKSEAMSFGAHRALVDLFPTEKPAFDTLMRQLGYDPTDTSTDASPAGVGNLCADAVLTFRHGDRSNQLGNLHSPPYSDGTGYAPINPPEPAAIVDPNHWQPLLVSNGAGGFVTQTYIGAHWGFVTPFALTSGSQFRPPAPRTTPFGSGTTPSPGYVAQTEQILRYSARLTDEQKVITEYWRDGPRSEQPPGHWCLIAQSVSARDRHDLDTDVLLFFALTNALLDAGIRRRAVHSIHADRSLLAHVLGCCKTGGALSTLRRYPLHRW